MRQRGAITVFFSIIFLALIVMLGAVVDSARLFSARNHIRMSTDTIIFSELSKYNRDLYDEYGLFAFDWGGNERIGNLFAGFHEDAPYEEQLLQLLHEQLMPLDGPDLYGYEVDSISVNAHYSLNNNQVMRHQILEHMKYRAPVLFIADFLNLATEFENVSEELDQVAETVEKMDEFYQLVDTLVNINRAIDGGSFYDENAEKEGDLVTVKDPLNELMSSGAKNLKENYEYYIGLIKDYFNLQDELSALQAALDAAEEEEEEEEIRALISAVQSEISGIRREIQDTYQLILRITSTVQEEAVKLRGPEMLGAVPGKRNQAITALNELISGATDDEIKDTYNGWLKIVRDDLPDVLSNLESELSVLLNEIAAFEQRLARISPDRLDSISAGDLDSKMDESLRNVFSEGLKSFEGIVEKLELSDHENPDSKLSGGDIFKIVSRVLKGEVSFGFDLFTSPDIDANYWGEIPDTSVLPSRSGTYDDKTPGLKAFLDTIKEVSALFSDMSSLIVKYVEQLYINQYVFDTFSTQADIVSAHLQEDKEALARYDDQELKSQVEYLVFGKDRDSKNNSSAKLSIGIIRAVLNVPYIFKNPANFALVTSLTGTLSIATLGFGYPVIKMIIVAAWACIEAMVDVTFLVKGETVPLLKDPLDYSHWFTSPAGLINYLISGTIGDYDKTSGISGPLDWDYKDYLSLVILIRVTTHDRLLGRIQDLIYLESDGALDSRHLFTYMQIEADVKVRNWFISMPLIESFEGKPSKHTIISVDMYRGY